jgi:hypothetical protein
MTTQISIDKEYRPQLRALSGVLQDVHRALIDFSRERYELVHGPVVGRVALLDLLLHDKAFAWLGPLSAFIVETDELAGRDVSPTEAEMEAIRSRAEELTSSSDDIDAFGSRYVGLLPSEPRVAMHHGELRAALSRLPARVGRQS